MTHLQTLTLDVIHPDPRSANCMSDERFAKLVENIRYTQQIQPLTVRPHPKRKQQFILVDGHYRLKALQELGWKDAPCDIWDIDTKAAGLLLATLNRLRGEDHPKKRAELLHELLEQFEKERLTTLIPETNHELEQLLALLEQENDLKAQLERQMQQERDALPVILNFVLSASEAQRVEAILETYHEDLNLALVLVCQEVADGTKAVD